MYGGFFTKAEFQKNAISAKKLYDQDSNEMARCRNRIVIVGGEWHQFGKGRGDLMEKFTSPIGDIPGLYLHANYVESLLDGNFRPALSGRAALGIDIVIAFLLYVCSRLARSRLSRIGVLLIFVALFAVAYISFANLGQYLDFTMPLSLGFVHLAVERVQVR